MPIAKTMTESMTWLATFIGTESFWAGTFVIHVGKSQSAMPKGSQVFPLSGGPEPD